ncbi:MAG TPA: hypothetical protein ENI77_09920 [Nitrospirae bacterium]|nr:hypothetical protein [Nitrospirota bacterium]
MKRFTIGALLLSTALAAGACTKQEPVKELKKKPETVREKAQAVGRVSDRILTNSLEKNLVGAVDSAKEHTAELEKAAE